TPGRGIGAHWATPCMPMGVFCHREGLSSIPGHSSGASPHRTPDTPAGDIPMKIVVIGGTGLIGSKVVSNLAGQGHDVIAAAPSTGIDILTGEGLDAAMAGTDVVVDLANSPSFEDAAVLDFFRTAGRNVLGAEAKAGVRHHLALSVVGTEKLAASGYFRGKI